MRKSVAHFKIQLRIRKERRFEQIDFELKNFLYFLFLLFFFLINWFFFDKYIVFNLFVIGTRSSNYWYKSIRWCAIPCTILPASIRRSFSPSYRFRRIVAFYNELHLGHQFLLEGNLQIIFDKCINSITKINIHQYTALYGQLS